MNFIEIFFLYYFQKKTLFKTHFDAKNVFEFQWLDLQLDTVVRCDDMFYIDQANHQMLQNPGVPFILPF